MQKLFKYWLVGILVVFGFGLTSKAIQAATVNDPSISSVTLGTISSTQKEASGVSYTLTITTTATLSANSGFSIQTRPTSCMTNYENCSLNFQAPVTISGLNGTVTSTGYGNMFFSNSDVLPAGSYTFTINNVINPNFDGSLRFAFSVPTSNISAINLEGDSAATVSETFVIGSPLVKGRITHPTTGAGLMLSGQVASQDWSINQFFNTDEWGEYAVANPGFSAGATVNLTINPDSGSGLASTATTFTYSGSTATVNLSPTQATKSISGTVLYEDTGTPVATASVNANGKGNGWSSAIPDSAGAYLLTIGGGEYDICLGDRFDDNGNKLPRDWYVAGDNQCQTVSFAKDTAVEASTINFLVKRADAKIIGVFKNPNGSFPSNGSVMFSQEGLWFNSGVNRDNGAFEVALVGNQSYQGQYQSQSTGEHMYWDTDSVRVNTNQTVDLGTITLKERDVVYTATVKDNNGTPVPHIYVDAWQERGGWTHAETDQNGVATLYLYEGSWSIRPSTWNTATYIYSGKEDRVQLAAGSSASGAFTLTATTLVVTALTNTADGSAASVTGWVNCWQPGNNFGFGGQVRNGTGTFGAIAGDFQCNLMVNDESYQAAGETRTTFTAGVNTTLNFTLLRRTATVTVYIKDQDGKLVDAKNGRVSARSTASGMIDKRLESGQVALRLAPGSYNLGIWFEGDQSKYISSQGPNSGTDVTVVDNDALSKTLTVFAVSATLEATVKDNDGNPVSDAWVHCGNWPELKGTVKMDDKNSKIIESGAPTDANGKATVGLVAGHEYECNVGVKSETSDLVGSASQTIDFTTAKKATAKFILQKANAKITGKITMADAADITTKDLNNIWCHAWSDEGYNSFGDGSANKYTLNAIVGTWNVSCGGEATTANGKRQWYSSPRTVVTITAAGTVTQDLVLAKSLFEIPESYSETFDSTQPKSITLSDGTRLNIPAYALATDGNVTLTAEPELQAIDTYTDGLAKIPWNFEVYDSSGKLISGDFNDKVTLIITYDQAVLNKLGIDETTLLPKYFDVASNIWKNVDNASQDTAADEITFTLSHFSQVGLVYNQKLNQASPSKPYKLKAKRLTATTALLTWKKPTQRKATYYNVQLRLFKDKEKTTWQTFTAKKTKQAVKKLTANTKYQFRVKACNKKKCFKFSSWAKFKTKRS